MTLKNDVKKKTGEFLSNSLEMFDKIFAHATSELKIRRKPKPAVQKPATETASDILQLKEEKPKPSTKREKATLRPKQAERAKPAREVKFKPKPRPKAGRGSRVLRVSLLIVLLLVLAGFFANYFAVIDLAVIPDLLGLGPKPIVQAPIPKKQPAKPPEGPAIPPKQTQAQEKVPTPPPAPSEPTPPAVSKEDKLVEIETPTTIAPLKAEKERVEEKPPSAPPATEQSKPSAVAAKQESQPAPVQPQITTKPAAPEAAPSRPATPQYPYSVYLGSFKAPEAVKKALSDYQEKGLSAYWAKVDLGDKGVWYRFFAGYFRTKEEAEKHIRDHNLQGATPGFTKYANFIGRYGSDKETEDQKRALVSAGFYPYVIKTAEGNILLYSGVFDRKEYAEKERDDLASKGIKSEVVER